jgi:hypothetical protein
MRADQLPADEQLSQFRAALHENSTLIDVLARAAAMDLPGWYLVAGCVYQTVWNVVTGRPAQAGILDYDLAYFDDLDLSWEAEDEVIQAGNTVFAGLPAPVQIRNQARVHLWYEQKFGVPCPPHTSTEAAIDTYEATTAWPRHEVTEHHPDGGFTIRYLTGPKQGLLIHFFTSTELDKLFADGYTPVLPPRLQATRRIPPRPGQWSQWEAIWRRDMEDSPA